MAAASCTHVEERSHRIRAGAPEKDHRGAQLSEALAIQRPDPGPTVEPGTRRVDQPDILPALEALIDECGGDAASRDGRLVREVMLASLKLITDERNTGELKLLANSFKEMRHAYRVFADYGATPKISIFGSARTPADHPDYRRRWRSRG